MKKHPDPRQLTFDFLRHFDDNECSEVYEKPHATAANSCVGARTPGQVRPNAVIAAPILPDPPPSGKGSGMDIRQQRGQQIASSLAIVPKDGCWTAIPGQPLSRPVAMGYRNRISQTPFTWTSVNNETQPLIQSRVAI